MLNPYSVDVEMFKIEDNDDHKPLDNVMFYGISAKRYCLYKIDNGNIEILKYSTHGLGHLKDIDGKRIWESILTKNFNEYNDKIAVSQITISRPSILNRFRKMNSGKPYDKQIKPLNCSSHLWTIWKINYDTFCSSLIYGRSEEILQTGGKA